jgi:serine/threonine protein kinase
LDKEKENLEYAVEDLNRRQRELRRDLSIMRGLGKHLAIAKMLGWDNMWKPHAPVIFYEYCPLGNVVTYYNNLADSLTFTPEHALWKLFSDLAKAFDFIHNKQDIQIIRSDVNPDNILVADGPLLHFDNRFTSLPTFKLADFSRSIEYRPQFAEYKDG